MILVALGANLPGRFGAPAATLSAAITAMAARSISVIKASRVWLSAPVPVSEQPDYCNAVALVNTVLSPHELIAALQAIERDFGRVRINRNEARIIDLDLIAYHDQIINDAILTLPHPRLQDRAFVLLPLQDIAPDWVYPVSNVKLTDMITRLPPGQVIKAGMVQL